MNNEKSFEYTYSAKDQEELRRIRAKYLPAEESGLDYIRRLDAGVTGKATAWSLITGVLSTLIFGAGLSCILVFSDILFIPGLVISILGLGGIAAAYPVYDRVLQKERARIAPEILRLTEELRL